MSLNPTIAKFWDAAADSFDDEADHGLRIPRVRKAWAARLAAWLPGPPADVLDLGCGTGSLSLLVAEQGHRVTGVDLSPRMIEHALGKLSVANVQARMQVGDIAELPSSEDRVDVILARHVLWTLPDPAAVLRDWITRLRPGGRLLLVEGRWNTPAGDDTYVEGTGTWPWRAGVSAQTLASTLRPLVARLRVEPLTDPELWGRVIDDERYCVLATS